MELGVRAPKNNAMDMIFKRIIPGFYGSFPPRLHFGMLIYRPFTSLRMDWTTEETAGHRCAFCSVMPKISRMFLRSVWGNSRQACGRSLYMRHALVSSSRNGQGADFNTQSPSTSRFKCRLEKSATFIPRCFEMRTMSRSLKMGLVVLQQLAQTRQSIRLKAASCPL